MARVSNNTDRPIYCNVEGIAYEFTPGKSLDVKPRTAMLLAEYGLSINRDAVEEELAAASEASKVVGTDEPTVEPVVSPSALHGTDVPPMPGAPTGESISTSGAPYQAPAERNTVAVPVGMVSVPIDSTSAGSPPPSTTPEPGTTTDDASTAAEGLKGQALDDALDAAGLSKSGTADEKRARYAEWLRAGSPPPS